MWKNDSNIYFNIVALCVYAAIDCGHPLLLYTGAVFLPVFALFPIHRHQKEGKEDCSLHHASCISNNAADWVFAKKPKKNYYNAKSEKTFCLDTRNSCFVFEIISRVSVTRKMSLSLPDCPPLFSLPLWLHNVKSVCLWTFAFHLSVSSLMCEIKEWV